MTNNEIAACGLICFLCNEKINGKCEGCASKTNCEIKDCCSKQNISSCSECTKDNCTLDNHVSSNIRVQAFNTAISIYGKQKVTDALIHNETNGIHYHKNGCEKGDYDNLNTKNEIITKLMKDSV